MAFLDSIIGKGSIDRQRRMADEAARQKFNPDIVLPQLEEAQRTAREGIVDEPLRRQALEQILGSSGVSETEQSEFGVGQGRFLSFMGEQNQNVGSMISKLETELALEEERARREGRMQAANIMSKRRELISQRESQIAENRALAEAEASRRKGKFLGSIAKFAISAAGGAPGIGSFIGGKLRGDSIIDQFVKETPKATAEPTGADFIFGGESAVPEEEERTGSIFFG